MTGRRYSPSTRRSFASTYPESLSSRSCLASCCAGKSCGCTRWIAHAAPLASISILRARSSHCLPGADATLHAAVRLCIVPTSVTRYSLPLPSRWLKAWELLPLQESRTSTSLIQSTFSRISRSRSRLTWSFLAISQVIESTAPLEALSLGSSHRAQNWGRDNHLVWCQIVRLTREPQPCDHLTSVDKR